MNKKLIFRILGALSSALIIVSVFLPYVSALGYTKSLWQVHDAASSLYLPIIILVFGVLATILFMINIKTEFAYMSAGAILFYVVVEGVDIINQEMLGNMGLGYYLLLVGAIGVGLFAFLSNLKDRNNNSSIVSNDVNNFNNNNAISNLESIDQMQSLNLNNQVDINSQVVNPV
ncbi:MAG: hypothetical protein Q4E75_05900, partial [bacterium]|nr:hypothetical protein [bacterium]